MLPTSGKPWSGLHFRQRAVSQLCSDHTLATKPFVSLSTAILSLPKHLRRKFQHLEGGIQTSHGRSPPSPSAPGTPRKTCHDDAAGRAGDCRRHMWKNSPFLPTHFDSYSCLSGRRRHSPRVICASDPVFQIGCFHTFFYVWIHFFVSGICWDFEKLIKVCNTLINSENWFSLYFILTIRISRA